MLPDPRELRTPRLRLRPLTADDIPAIARYRDDPEVARHQSWDRYTEADARALVEQLAGRTPGTPGQWFQWGITRASDGLLLGDCGLKILGDEPRLGQIGYTLGRAHQRHGYATEAVRAVLDLAFHRLRLHRVSASVDADNHASLALLERLGLRREAHFKQAEWFKGAWVDDVIYAVLETEWPGPDAQQPPETAQCSGPLPSVDDALARGAAAGDIRAGGLLRVGVVALRGDHRRGRDARGLRPVTGRLHHAVRGLLAAQALGHLGAEVLRLVRRRLGRLRMTRGHESQQPEQPDTEDL